MRLSYLTVNLVHGSLCKCDLNAKYNNTGNCGECALFSFIFSLVRAVSGLSICCFIFRLCLMLFGWLFSWNYTKIFRSVRITHAGSSSYIILRFCPKIAQMENSTTITKSDCIFAHHPIPNAKFQPITL